MMIDVLLETFLGCGFSYLKRNCLLRLDTSIVSISMTSMLPNPVSARSLRSSHPSPPAPTIKILLSLLEKDR